MGGPPKIYGIWPQVAKNKLSIPKSILHRDSGLKAKTIPGMVFWQQGPRMGHRGTVWDQNLQKAVYLLERPTAQQPPEELSAQSESGGQLMIEILHHPLVKKHQVMIVVQSILGHAGFLSPTVPQRNSSNGTWPLGTPWIMNACLRLK